MLCSSAVLISYSFSPRPPFPLPPPTPPTSTGPSAPSFPPAVLCMSHPILPFPPPLIPDLSASLRNLSSADAGRQTMRNYTGLIDALMAYVQNCVAASRCDDKVSARPWLLSLVPVGVCLSSLEGTPHPCVTQTLGGRSPQNPISLAGQTPGWSPRGKRRASGSSCVALGGPPVRAHMEWHLGVGGWGPATKRGTGGDKGLDGF